MPANGIRTSKASRKLRSSSSTRPAACRRRTTRSSRRLTTRSRVEATSAAFASICRTAASRRIGPMASRARHVLLPDHPIAAGLPETFTIPHTEMYDEPFHVPEPDEVIFREDWELGEKFRSGCVWKLGEGHVFYFRPGHETFDVYLQTEPLQVLENASRWLGSELPD